MANEDFSWEDSSSGMFTWCLILCPTALAKNDESANFRMKYTFILGLTEQQTKVSFSIEKVILS